MLGWNQPSYQEAGGLSWDAGGQAPTDEILVNLVAQVKNLQRGDPVAKEQWVSYVEQQGHGRLDPSKHTPEFLQAFVTQFQSGVRLPVSEVAAARGQHSDPLVAQIKELQRRDPRVNEQWIAYVEVSGQGLLDPTKHSREFLEAFLLQLHSSIRVPLPIGEDGCLLGEFINLMQKRSIPFKSVWERYCQHYGGGRYDPAKHNSSYHIKFLDFMAHQACLKMSSTMPMQMGGCEGPQKRLRDDSSMGLTMDGGSSKEQLVLQVETFQRSGADQRDLWAHYCDLYLQGIRDPAKHDAATLQEFCTNHNVPKVESGPLNLMNMPMAAMGGLNLPGMGLSGGGGEKDQLVHQVKQFQRMSSEAYELWGTYADSYLQGVRDPSRHDAATLQEFVTNHNVPKVESAPVNLMNMPMASMGAMGGGMNMAMGRGGGGGGGGGEKDQLVNQVKQFQRSGPQQYELWATYADSYLQGVRDPSRHDGPTLKEFCDNHNVPPCS